MKRERNQYSARLYSAVNVQACALRFAARWPAAAGKGSFLLLTRHLFLSARRSFGNVPGYFHSSLSGLEGSSSQQCRRKILNRGDSMIRSPHLVSFVRFAGATRGHAAVRMGSFLVAYPSDATQIFLTNARWQ